MLTKQTTFNNFCDFLPDPRPITAREALKREVERRAGMHGSVVVLKRCDVLEAAETRCVMCGKRLVYNGYNDRTVIHDFGLGKRHYRIHRKRCPDCGDVQLDLTFMVQKYKRYAESYIRRARQHHVSGLYPKRTVLAMQADFRTRIPRTTVVTWVNKMRAPLRELHSQTYLPMSGYLHHDESYLKIRGHVAYVQESIDSITGMALASTISVKNDRSAVTRHLSSIKHGDSMRIKSLVMDGTAKLGTLLKTRLFKHITRAQCILHFKWRVHRKLMQLAGYGEAARKSLPKQYHGLRQLFWNVLDSHDETGAFFAVERLRVEISHINKKYLTTLFKDIEAKLQQIIAWQRDLFIERTNNKIENYHQWTQYYPTFKTRMMSQAGAQLVADARLFLHNFREMPAYMDRLRSRKEQYKAWSRETPRDPSLAGCPPYFYYETGRVLKAYEKYEAFWDAYLEY